MQETRLTLELTVVMKPEAMETENGVTAEQKEAQTKQLIQDQVATIARNYDWGIAVTGTLESDVEGSDPVEFNDVKPDYEV